jgi:hypothetical protein
MAAVHSVSAAAMAILSWIRTCACSFRGLRG